ncbi:protein translocase, SecG subunit [Alysiella filiformis DSM 16848]|uniref:Protein-export membrane protein SecG n=1 Tax=Alysiella filiformis DSM 16848 TaxID=1120981 RepID=A0A286E684_9NEIS|nr:preprotein translocase subunit SecG [Alysiella filiformis]SOD66410.1 protein translocase, SecG subunit [Alysiella filiformis DSM 16848]
MEAFKTIIWIINIFSSLTIIALVLMQHGKGADAGASFGGSGSAQGVFGSSGNANFLTRMTSIAAMVFFASCLALGYVNSKASKNKGMDFSGIQQSQATSQHSAPAAEIPKLEATTASAEASSAVSSGVGQAAIAAGAGAAIGKVAADKVSEKNNQADNKNSSKKTETDKKKSSSTDKSKGSNKTAAKTENKKTEKSK